MQKIVNYLLCRNPPDISSQKDLYVKIAATGVGLTLGGTALGYAITSVNSYITKENAQYCAIQGLALLTEIQKQMELFNASCIAMEPGSDLSICNMSLLPKPNNTSCLDSATAGVANYLPMVIMAAGVATFGFLMGRTMVVSRDQLNEQNRETWHLCRETWGHLGLSDADTLSEFSDTSIDNRLPAADT